MWHEQVSRELRKRIPKGTRDSADAVEWLYEKQGFKLGSVERHVPWLFFKHRRQLELYFGPSLRCLQNYLTVARYNSDMSNQRKVPRVPVFRRTLLDDLSVPANNLVAMATVYQLGALGCGLRTMKGFAIGSRVRLTFFDDNEDNPLSMIGLIVWHTPIRRRPINATASVSSASKAAPARSLTRCST